MFLIFSANSIPRIITAAISSRLNPSIGLTRCFIRWEQDADFEMPPALPLIQFLNPAEAPASVTLELTVNGRNFTDQSIIVYAGTSVVTTFANSGD
jgi:hypothetical protein